MESPAPPTSCGPPPPTQGTKTSIPKKKWVVNIPTNEPNVWKFNSEWKFDAERVDPLDIEHDKVNWEDIEGVVCSEEGTGGVFFVQIRNQGALVIKGSSTIASDMFSSMLASRLGIQVPNTIVHSYLEDKEWTPMVQSLWKIEATNSEEGRGSKLSKCLLRPFLMVMKYIKGYDLEHINPGLAKDIMKKENLLEIGKILSFDILINNWDRLPCIWENNGNPKNVIFNTNGRPFAIDSTITSIDPKMFAANFKNYKDKVELLLSSITSEPTKEANSIHKLRTFLVKFIGLDIGEEGSIVIQQGLISSLQSISAITTQDLDNLKKIVENKLFPTMELLGLDHDTVSLTRINIEFMTEIVQLFKKYLSK